MCSKPKASEAPTLSSLSSSAVRPHGSTSINLSSALKPDRSSVPRSNRARARRRSIFYARCLQRDSLEARSRPWGAAGPSMATVAGPGSFPPDKFHPAGGGGGGGASKIGAKLRRKTPS
ncbi:hypothetical protein NL676_013499 [Syzygium grande]|nr:hypothetical protein NL676_013499 [Syzygium grande]